MQKEFSTSTFSRWVSNFDPNDAVPFVTTSGLIKLDDLESFIAKIKTLKADSVRVYFLRLQTNEPPFTSQVQINGQLAKGCKWHNASNTLTQATLALVPAKNFKLDDDLVFSADDITVGSQVLTLMPGIEDKGTGLCPPSCSPHTVGGH
jgi:hypothetical protein